MSTSTDTQAAAAMARVQQHINRSAAQHARRMTEGWARIGRATPAATTLQPPPPTPPAPLPPPGQRGSVVMLGDYAAEDDTDTGPELVGNWCRQVAAAGAGLAVLVVLTLALSAGLAHVMLHVVPLVLP